MVSDEIEQVIEFFNSPAAAEAMLEVRSKTSRTGEKSSTSSRWSLSPAARTKKRPRARKVVERRESVRYAASALGITYASTPGFLTCHRARHTSICAVRPSHSGRLADTPRVVRTPLFRHAAASLKARTKLPNQRRVADVDEQGPHVPLKSFPRLILRQTQRAVQRSPGRSGVDF